MRPEAARHGVTSTMTDLRLSVLWVLVAAHEILTRAKGTRKMAALELETMLVMLGTGFEKIARHYAHTLATVKKKALRNKAQCEQCVTDMSLRHQEVADTVQTHLDKVQGLIAELSPLIRGAQRLEKKHRGKRNSS